MKKGCIVSEKMRIVNSNLVDERRRGIRTISKLNNDLERQIIGLKLDTTAHMRQMYRNKKEIRGLIKIKVYLDSQFDNLNGYSPIPFSHTQLSCFYNLFSFF